jgi:phosphohistidine phosphatase
MGVDRPGAGRDPRRVIVFLVRHAHALDEQRDLPDPARPLSVEGRAQARAIGLRLRWHDCTPTALWTSPLTRAVMTAELVAAALDWPGPIDSVPALAPEGRTAEVLHRLAASDPDGAIVVFGHEPSISALGASLTGDPDFPALAKAEAVRIDGRVVRWRFAWDAAAPRAP